MPEEAEPQGVQEGPTDLFTIRLHPRMQATIDEMGADLGMDRGAVIREALSLYHWAWKEARGGSRLVIQRGDKVTELIIPSLRIPRAP